VSVLPGPVRPLHRADRTVRRTGYKPVRNDFRALFGAEVIDPTSEAWGLDEEGEIQGAYRPSGHPGVSYLRFLHIALA
jgi:hypothetical protein